MWSSMTLMRQSAAASKHGAGQSCGLMQGLVESRPTRLLAKPFVSLDLPPGVFASHYLASFRFSFGMFNNYRNFLMRIFELPHSSQYSQGFSLDEFENPSKSNC